mmetsp:Transcript_134491/g.389189  ORF Transcript_134491/g.389189 Transcript_134491/m.389189 type:complete len:214 (-) Transcript_134491:86-727(-)
MLPIGGMGPPAFAGELTPEMREKLSKIRHCVYGIYFAAVGRLCTGDMPINELIVATVGVFLLKDDDNVGACYACLMNSFFGQCAGPRGGGMSCLSPFLFLSSFNCIFLALRLFAGGPFVLLSFCFQLSGAMCAWRLNQLVSAAALAELTGSGQGEPLNQAAQMRMVLGGDAGRTVGGGQGRPGGGGGGAAAAVQGPSRFSAFQGQGHRLADGA